jgi:hypothetical protein
MEVIRVNAEELVTEFEGKDFDSVPLGQLKSLYKTAGKVAGKLNGIPSLVERRSATSDVGKSASPLSNLFTNTNGQGITEAAANAAGFTGENAVQRFIEKVRVQDQSVTSAKIFASLPLEKRRTLTYKVKQHNLSIG